MIRPDNRLRAIALCVRDKVTLYDVGTDHGYLPVFLVKSGRTERAVASDIAPGPLSRAEKVIRENGLGDSIKTVLTGGLEGITLSAPCDIVIAGMGGDTICSIIGDKPEVKNEGVRLVLQPMTKQYELRKYLCENGFAIEKETLAKTDRIYQIITAFFDGKKRNASPAELFLGSFDGELRNEYLLTRREMLLSIKSGKEKAGIDCSFEDGIIRRIEELLK